MFQKVKGVYRRLINWLSRLWTWLGEMKILWLFGLVVILALLIALHPEPTEFKVRFAGYTLEMLGIVLTFGALKSLWIEFEQPSLRLRGSDWLKRYPRWVDHYVLMADSMKSESTVSKARLILWSPDNPTRTTKKRINSIVANLERLKESDGEHHKKLCELEESSKKLASALDQKNEELAESMNTRLEHLHAGGVSQSLMGLIWLAIGLTLGTLSNEIISIIGYFKD